MKVRRKLSAGFTLIEVLVAMAIFGVMSILAYQALGQTFFNADELGQRMDRLQAIQRTMRLLGRDLMQTAPRPVRDPYDGPSLPAIRTSATSLFALELTHGGWPNPAGLPRSTLQRVAWRIEDGELVRLHWGVLDTTLNTDPVGTILLDGVESIEFRYLGPTGQWTNQWPPLDPNNQGPATLRLRPRVVEVILVLSDEGEIRRFFEVAP